MTARSARSSDRAQLRELARRLRPGPTAPVPAAAESYVRLRAPVAPAAPAPAPVAPPPRPAELEGSAGWGRLLDWCISGLGARAALLTDDRGLLIASAGGLDHDLAQGIAARLVIAFHQADRMTAAPAPAMAIELEDGWLSGMRVVHGDEPLTFGVLMTAPLDDAARRVLREALTLKAGAA